MLSERPGRRRFSPASAQAAVTVHAARPENVTSAVGQEHWYPMTPRPDPPAQQYDLKHAQRALKSRRAIAHGES